MEIVDDDGSIWRPADVVLGKSKRVEGPPYMSGVQDSSGRNARSSLAQAENMSPQAPPAPPLRQSRLSSGDYIAASSLQTRPYHLMPPLNHESATFLNHGNLIHLLDTDELLPYPLIRRNLQEDVQFVMSTWPLARELGLRPVALLRFIHEIAEILVFLPKEDDTLYLWSRGWDASLFPNARLIRAARTIEECELGIAGGLHILDPEQGGWIFFEGASGEVNIGRDAVQEEEDIYGWDLKPEQAYQI